MLVRRSNLRMLTGYYLFLAAAVLAAALLIPVKWSVVEAGLVEPARRALVKSKVEGVLSEIHVKDGDPVKEGQLIARVSNPAIKEMLAGAEAELTRARMELDYARAMHRRGYVPDNEFREAQLNHDLWLMKSESARSYDIIAPMDGILLTTDEFVLRRGDHVQEGTVIATVAKLDRMRMKVRILEHNIPRVQIGNEARIYLNAYPAMRFKTLSGRVSHIVHQAQSDSSGVRFVAVIDLEPMDGRSMTLIPGMAGTAKIVYENSSFVSHIVGQTFESFTRT